MSDEERQKYKEAKNKRDRDRYNKMTDEGKQNHMKKCKDLSEEQKQKRRDYQKQYIENITDEQKQKLKDYGKEYYKRYYIEKKEHYKCCRHKMLCIKSKNKITFVCRYYKDESEKNKISKQRS